jgi:hypothetical protein
VKESFLNTTNVSIFNPRDNKNSQKKKVPLANVGFLSRSSFLIGYSHLRLTPLEGFYIKK